MCFCLAGYRLSEREQKEYTQINRRFGSHAGVACVTVARMRLKQAQQQAK